MKNNKNLLKVFIIIAIIIVIAIIGIVLFNQNSLKVAKQRREEGYENLDDSKYPGYKEKLEAIKKEHPNWNFTILYTDLDWNDVIFNEAEANHGLNLVDASEGEVGTAE